MLLKTEKKYLNFPKLKSFEIIGESLIDLSKNGWQIEYNSQDFYLTKTNLNLLITIIGKQNAGKNLVCNLLEFNDLN